jgi:hypothetical protein
MTLGDDVGIETERNRAGVHAPQTGTTNARGGESVLTEISADGLN